MAKSGVKANKVVILFALATASFCLLSLSLKFKTTVVVSKYQAKVDNLATTDPPRAGELALQGIEAAELKPKAEGKAGKAGKLGKPRWLIILLIW